MNSKTIFALLLLVLIQKCIVSQDIPCDIRLSVSIEGGEDLLNGSVLHNNVIYPKDLHFLYNASDLNQERRGCICMVKPCVRKCCPPNESLMEVDNAPPCVNSTHEFTHVVTDIEGNEIPNVFSDFGVVYGNPCSNIERYPLEPDEYYLLQNGSLYLPDNEEIVDVLQYCMDYVIRKDDTLSRVKPLQCFDDTEEPDDMKFKIYPIGMILSIPFLIATFLVYAILPELQTLHGKSLMNYVAGLAVAYSFLSYVQLGNTDVSSSACVPLGLIIYYAFMFSFFWLNVMSFDVWYTFSGWGGFRSRSPTSARRKFLYYSLYAWLATTITFSITIALQFHPDVPKKHKPGIGMTKCWLADAAIFSFFYVPVIILIAVNTVFFSLTAYKIYSSDRETVMLRQEGSNRHSKDEDAKQRFWLYIKLFLIMGVNWSLEIISSLVGGPTWLWITTDIVNTIQGMLIFFFFVWKPKVRQMVRRRYNTWRGIAPANTGYRSANSTDSTHLTMLQINRNANSTSNPSTSFT